MSSSKIKGYDVQLSPSLNNTIPVSHFKNGTHEAAMMVHSKMDTRNEMKSCTKRLDKTPKYMFKGLWGSENFKMFFS